MCGHFCIGSIDFMLAGKTLIDFDNIFSPNKYYFVAGIKERELMSKRLSTMKDLLRVCI